MDHGDIIKALAPRLTMSLAMVDRAIVHAPQEFYPIEAVRHALEQIEGHGSRTVIDVRDGDDIDRLRQEIRHQSRPLFVAWHGLDQQFEELLRTIRDRGEDIPLLQRSVVVAAAIDRRPDVGLGDLFDTELGSGSLVLDAQVLRELGPEQAADAAWCFRTLRVTGGVPALWEAFAEDLDAAGGEDLTRQWVRLDSRPSPGRSADVTAAWVERAYPAWATDPLVLLHAWTHFIPEPMMAGIASYILDRRVSVSEVRQARLNGVITRPGASEPGFPVLLAAQTVDRMMTDPASPARLWRRRTRSAMIDRALPIPDAVRICMLTMIRDWPSLDALLASSMHILATFAANERQGLAEAWADQVPPEWAHIAYARKFLQGTWGYGPPALPLPWRELAYLVTGEEPEPSYPQLKELHQRLLVAMSRLRPDSAEDMREFARTAEQVLTDLTSEQLERHTPRSRRSVQFIDDAATLALCLVGLADGMIATALLSDAQACLALAATVCTRSGIDVASHPALVLGLTARSAMLSGKTALYAQARSYITEYERLVTSSGARDELPEQLIRIAIRYDSNLTMTGPSSADISLNTPFAPLQVEAEGWALLVNRGTLPAYQWLQAFLGRSRWSNLMAFEWWPLHATLAMIDVREGRLHESQRRLEDGSIPSEMALVIRAAAKLVEGHQETVETLVDRVLATPTTTTRWRMIAYGLKLGAVAGGPDPEDVAGMVLHLYDWADAPGALALLPDPARKPILDHVGSPFSELAGLRIRETVDGVPAGSVRLTPRQIDVLQGLVEGKTLGRIAVDLGLGKETVRSTAKQMYKRLGVHDRASAVLMGQALGMI
ncbi:LuxR-type HTH domain profile [Propionibacterium ruminifibrarum]|uniref:LuxR-type HTH domain profile n=1 Tax=Propionibacterium ruminifibrarum TaxID=1962131 RepID=A0A375I6L5_9ACTN|nr:LuxR C-terminal-related transcriptional regulator [Propionibacterium ruminifibrarum]SPF69058.1 LuxR-type HTH domain profile [Propionibacterium ruminifibrarum]